MNITFFNITSEERAELGSYVGTLNAAHIEAVRKHKKKKHFMRRWKWELKQDSLNEFETLMADTLCTLTSMDKTIQLSKMINGSLPIPNELKYIKFNIEQDKKYEKLTVTREEHDIRYSSNMVIKHENEKVIQILALKNPDKRLYTIDNENLEVDFDFSTLETALSMQLQKISDMLDIIARDHKIYLDTQVTPEKEEKIDTIKETLGKRDYQTIPMNSHPSYAGKSKEIFV
ncbi:MAG: hypothetical protein J5525_12375 [Lachnospiraceae bacterium]|nr:hypothetical protein [Lachnospiraceae bacterium]